MCCSRKSQSQDKDVSPLNNVALLSLIELRVLLEFLYFNNVVVQQNSVFSLEDEYDYDPITTLPTPQSTNNVV